MVASPKHQDTNRMVRGTQTAQPFRSFTSASAGLTYCAIGALAFLDDNPKDYFISLDVERSSGISLDDCARWIVGRQTTYLEEDETDAEEQTSHLLKPEAISLPSSPLGSPHSAHFPVTALQSPKATPARMQNAIAPVLNLSEEDLRCAGFNGRPNKIADTCYCFWNTGALVVRFLTLFEWLLC
jgi:geranylgeranyl transferase type-1 subunit beta